MNFDFDPFYVGLAIALVLIIAGAYVWTHGLLGTATEGRIKTFIAKAQHEVEMWEKKLAEKQSKSGAPVKDKATRIAENKTMLDAGIITQAQFDDAVRAILAND